MFADVRGFTSLSERVPLQSLRSSLNTMFGVASRILVENDALIDKFLGDAVMALFNAPIPNPHHREAALRTAVAILQETARLNLPFAIGIGLNSGIALTGNVVGGDVTDYTAIGDTVNVAARLSGLARPGEILVGSSVLGEGAGPPAPGYGLERVSLELKGKAQLVDAHRIYPLSPTTAPMPNRRA